MYSGVYIFQIFHIPPFEFDYLLPRPKLIKNSDQRGEELQKIFQLLTQLYALSGLCMYVRMHVGT